MIGGEGIGTDELAKRAVEVGPELVGWAGEEDGMAEVGRRLGRYGEAGE